MSVGFYIFHKKRSTLQPLIHEDNAYFIGMQMIAKYCKLFPQQQFDTHHQAASGPKIVARETSERYEKTVLPTVIVVFGFAKASVSNILVLIFACFQTTASRHPTEIIVSLRS